MKRVFIQLPKLILPLLLLLLIEYSSDSPAPVYAASVGGITNLQSAWGLCDGGGAYNLGRCKATYAGANYTLGAFACPKDNGVDPTHCEDNWGISGGTWSAMNNPSTGYFEIGRYVWPYQTGGVTQNDWVCKVQIDVIRKSDGALLDYVTWRDPQRCGTPPPTCTYGTPGAPYNLYPNGQTFTSTSIGSSWATNGARNCSNCSNCKDDFYAEVWKSGGGVFQTMGWSQTNNWSINANQGPGTYYWHVKQGNGYQASGWVQGSFTISSGNQAPTTSSVEINGNPVVPNTGYTITMVSTDANGGGNIVAMNAGPNIINNSYNGVSPDLAGYIGWTSLSRPPYWANDGDQWKNCSGGGHAVRNTQYSGYNKINLNNCYTSVSGNTRTVWFDVSFTSAFTGPSPSYLWGWVMDASTAGDPVTPNYYGWRRFGSFNVTQPVQPITWTINEKAICTNGAPDPSHVTRLWWVKTGSAPWPSGIDSPASGQHTYSITSTNDPQYMYFGMDDGTDPGNLQLTGNPPDSRITYGGYFGVYPRGVAMFKRDLPAPGPYTFYFAAPDSWCPLNYTVSTSAGAGGSISPSSRVVTAGSSTSFTVSPNSGYYIASASGCGGSLSGNTYYTGAINGNCTVSASFALSSYTVSTSAGAGGSISPSSRVVTAGSSTSFTVSPNSGYYISSASGCGGSLSGNTYYTGAINGNCTVSAGFALYYYTVTMTAGSGGSVLPGSRSVGYGGTTTFTVTPGIGYHIASVSGCGGSLSGNTYTTGAIYGSCTATATFALNSYTVSGAVSPAGVGSFSSLPASVTYGSYQTFNVNLVDAHYHLVSVLGSPCTVTSLGGTQYRAGPVTADCTVSANFAVNNGTLNVTSSGLAHAPYQISGDSTTYYTDTTPTKSLPPGNYTVNFLPVGGYQITSANPVTVVVRPDPAPPASDPATATYTPTSALTVYLYFDHNANGILDSGDNPVAIPLNLNCSPSTGADINCPSNPLTITGSTTMNLSQTTTYTFTYDINDGTNVAAGYRFVTMNHRDGAAGPPPYVTQTIFLGASSHTIDFLVTTNSPAWLQVWDGDSYGAFNNNPSMEGIKITVNSQASAMGYSASFIHDSLAGAGGGLALTMGAAEGAPGSNGIACNGQTCSERNWLMNRYPFVPLAWPAVIEEVTAPSANVCYESGSLTINSGNIGNYNGAGSCANKVVIVGGDLTFDAAGIAGPSRQVNAFFVVKGHTQFKNVASSSSPWVINGGLMSKNDSAGIDFSYSLDDNRAPAVVFKYNPAILINTTPLFQATYTWREVTP